MLRLEPFSDRATQEQINSALVSTNDINLGLSDRKAGSATRGSDRYGYLLPDLVSNPANRLPETPTTVALLNELGRRMEDPRPTRGSAIPSCFTYLGQFIDHDLTAMNSPRVNFTDPNLTPYTPEQIANLRNIRIPALDLDNVYAEAPYVGDDLLLIGAVTNSGGRPPGKVGNEFDLPRRGRSQKDPRYDRTARIGDPRDDENVIVAQLHVAFIRAHNAIVKLGHTDEETRALLRQRYQSIIVHDYLERVADPGIVAAMLAKPWPVFDPPDGGLFLPLEFTVAAFRFGHVMPRDSYNYNVTFPEPLAPLFMLFDVLARYNTLPERWIIQWENFVDGGSNTANSLGTLMNRHLFHLPPVPLAVADLLRGYVLGLPTGQALAGALRLRVLSDSDIASVATSRQLEILQQNNFLKATPLWFYILAEAAFEKTGRLGQLGSTLVAGVLIALIRRSPNSFMRVAGWSPASSPRFTLQDLLRLAEVL